MQTITKILTYLALALLLSPVVAQDAMLPSGETVGRWVHFDRAALWALLAVALAVLVAGRGRRMPEFPAVLSLALMTWGGVEAVIGLRQLFGFAASGHALYAMTGSFFNPGPYSGYLAMVLPVCVHEYMEGRKGGSRWRTVLAGGVALLILCVLPAGMSRSAWLAAGVACLWVYGSLAGWGRKSRELWLKRRGGVVITVAAGVALVLLAGVWLFQLKPDSARGRLLMWRMTGRAIAEAPWTGHGAGSFAAAYGEAQERYFAQGTYEEWEERVAGSPEYAFNEYLQAAVERGIPVAVGGLLVVGCCWWAGFRKGRYGLCGGLLALGIFAFSSYPLQLLVFVVTASALLAGCLIGRSKAAWLAVGIVATLWGGLRLPKDRQTEKDPEKEEAKLQATAALLPEKVTPLAASDEKEKYLGELQLDYDYLLELQEEVTNVQNEDEYSKKEDEQIAKIVADAILYLDQRGAFWCQQGGTKEAIHASPSQQCRLDSSSPNKSARTRGSKSGRSKSPTSSPQKGGRTQRTAHYEMSKIQQYEAKYGSPERKSRSPKSKE